MEVALSRRVSTSRQQQPQTMEQHLSRLHASVALQPDWHVADEHLYRDDGYRGATLKRPGLDRLRDRAAMAAFECVLMTAPDRLRTVVYLYPAGNAVASKSGKIPPFHYLCEGVLPWYHTSFSTS